MEIERKFHIPVLPGDLELGEGVPLEQGYLALEPVVVRLRRGASRVVLTVKGAGLLERVEVELELTPEQFEELWPLTATRRLTKVRHTLPFEDHLIELDLYDGRHEGLRVAEVEFATRAEAADFRPPPWFGVELTLDPRFKNAALAVVGAPPALPNGGISRDSATTNG